MIMRLLIALTVLDVVAAFGRISPGAGSTSSLQPTDAWQQAVPSQQETLAVSLSDARAIFLKNNLHLLAARYHLTASEADLVAAKLFPNPQFAVNTSFIDIASRPVDYSASQTTFRIDQLIELWGKRGKRIDAAAHSVESARSDFQNTLIQALADLQETFLTLVFAEKSYELASESYRLFNESVEIAGVRFRTGDISEAEVKKLQLERMDYSERLSDAAQEVADGLSQFRQMLGLDPGATVRPVYDFHPAMPAYQRDTLIAAALRMRPDLASAKEKAISDQSQLDLARATAWPDLTLGVELDRQGPNFKNTLGGGVGITLPIFNRNQDGIQRAEAELSADEAERRAKEQEVANDVSAAYDKYDNARKVMETISPTALKNADEVRAMAAKNYNSGNIGLIDFLETERIYNDAVQSYYNALKRFAINTVELERALGGESLQEKTQ